MIAFALAVLLTLGALFAGALLELGARPVTQETNREEELGQGDRLFVAMLVCAGAALAIVWVVGGTK